MRVFVGAVAVLLSAVAAIAAEHTTDSLDSVRERVTAGKALLLDVRELSEWDEGHLEQAKLLSLSELKKGLTPEDLAKRIPKGTPIYAHCKSGGRCLSAAEILQKAGYDVRPLKPGYQQLLDAGFPKAK